MMITKEIPPKLENIFKDKKINSIVYEYVEYLNSKSLSKNTIRNYLYDLIDYFSYCKNNNLSPAKSVKQKDLRPLLSHIINTGIKQSSVIRKISSVKSFCVFLKFGLFLQNGISSYFTQKILLDEFSLFG